MDFSRLKQFYYVAQTGSLTAASKILKIDYSTLSRSMKIFEYRMKAKLFERESKGLRLTPQGERVFKHASKIVQDTDLFLKTFHENGDEIQGEIKIVTTPFLAETELTHYLLPFLEKHNDVKVKIYTTTQDFEVQEADIAIRTLLPDRLDLEQRPLQTHTIKLWASKEYLEKFGVPRTPEDLDNHRLLVYEVQKDNVYFNSLWVNWILRVGNFSEQLREPFYQITSHEGLYHAACKGYGIVQLSGEWTKIKNSPLIQVLPELEAPKVDIYFICNKKIAKLKRISAIYEYILKCMKEGR